MSRPATVNPSDRLGAGSSTITSPEPGPLVLQDHGQRVRYRNIWVLPLE